MVPTGMYMPHGNCIVVAGPHSGELLSSRRLEVVAGLSMCPRWATAGGPEAFLADAETKTQTRPSGSPRSNIAGENIFRTQNYVQG